MRDEISALQKIVLRAVAHTGWLSWEDMNRCKFRGLPLPWGVYRDLIRSGYFNAPPNSRGYEITDKGRHAAAQLEKERDMDRRARRAA